MPLTIGNWLLAIIPVLVVIILMLVFRSSGKQAGAAGLLVAFGIAMLFFGAGIKLVAYSQVKAIILSLDVLYVIWTALLLYNIANEAGAIRTIGERLPRLTSDRVIQTLLLGWLLVSFLQGMGGFGVPVAICAPLLVGMGFGPLQAVVMASLGHAWAVNFGSLAAAFQSLMAVTGLPGEMLAPASAVMLGAASLPCGMIVAFIGCGWKGLKRGLPAILILSGVMGVVQYLLATNGLWSLGATGAAIAGLLTCLLLLKIPMYKSEPQADKEPTSAGNTITKPFLLTLSAYAILVLLAFTTMLIPPVRNYLSQVKVSLPFPELATSNGWVTPAESSRTINLFGHPGAILLYTSIISSLIYWRTGYFKPGSIKRIFSGVGKSAVTASLGVITMVSLATLMTQSGMTNMLARGLSESFGPNVYPAVAPFIGALGGFITGSNNNSNVLFAVMQQDAALLLNLSVPLILAAQTAGGSIGSIMSPAKVIVGCSTVGLSGKEGSVMRKTMLYGLIPIVVVAILATIFTLV